MRRFLGLTLAFAFAAVARAAPDTTTISWTVLAPNGSPATSGTVTAVLSGPATAPDGAGSSSVMTRVVGNIASNGTVLLELVPNDIMTPSDTYYTFQYAIRTPVSGSSAEKRIVLASPDPANIGNTILVSPTPGIASPYATVMEEAAPLARRAKINFVGTAVTCVDNAGQTRTDCTITGGTEASEITVVDAGVDATMYPLLGGDPTGALQPRTDTAFAYNANTGTLTVPTVVAALTGNASTAAALASNPVDCSSNQFAWGIAASGNLSCAALVDADVPNNITIDLATAASALASNPTDCAANQFANTIAANGNLACSTIVDADVPNTITVDLAAAATALAANPADCSSNQFANAINASGTLACSALVDADIPNTITIDLAAAATALAVNPTDCTGGQFATAIAANGNLTCSTPVGSGDVLGPASSTDTAVPKYSGTGGKTLVNTLVTIDATNKVTAPGGLDGGDPGDTLRRMDVLGNTLPLTATIAPGMTGWYAVGDVGSEVPIFKNGGVGTYVFLHSRSTNAITPAMVLGSPTDEFCLTYEATGATWAWQTCGSSGGNVATDTLWSTAGEIVYSTGNDAAAVLAPGTAGYILQSNAASAPTWVPKVIVAESSPAAGQILVHDGVDSYDNKTMSGDATLNSAGALAIADDRIEPSDINTTNAGTPLQCLAKASGGGDEGTWVTCGAPPKFTHPFVLFDRTALVDADDIKSMFRAPANVTVTEVWCETDAGTSTFTLERRSDGADLVTGCPCTSTGAACGSLGAVAYVDGALMDFVMVVAGGTAKRISVHVEYTYD